MSDSLDIEFLKLEGKESWLSIHPSSQNIPLWYRMIDPIRKWDTDYGVEENFTVKKCIPVLDAFTTGYMLKTKFDLTFDYDDESEESAFYFDANYYKDYHPITMHPFEQIRGMEVDDQFRDYAYKFTNPYVIKTPPGYSCIFTHPFNQIYPFYTLTGVVDTDTYELAVQLPFLMRKDFKGVIKKGTPIVQIIPFKRDDWKVLITEDPTSKETQIHSKAQEELGQSRRNPDGSLGSGYYKKTSRVKKRYR